MQAYRNPAPVSASMMPVWTECKCVGIADVCRKRRECIVKAIKIRSFSKKNIPKIKRGKDPKSWHADMPSMRLARIGLESRARAAVGYVPGSKSFGQWTQASKSSDDELAKRFGLDCV